MCVCVEKRRYNGIMRCIRRIIFHLAVKCIYIQNRYEKHQSCSLVNDCLCCCCLLQCIRCWYVMHKTIQCIKMLALITKNALLNAHRCAFERAIADGIRNFNYYSSSRFEYFEYYFHVCRYYVRLSIEVEDGKEKHPKIFYTKHTSMVWLIFWNGCDRRLVFIPRRIFSPMQSSEYVISLKYSDRAKPIDFRLVYTISSWPCCVGHNDYCHFSYGDTCVSTADWLVITFDHFVNENSLENEIQRFINSIFDLNLFPQFSLLSNLLKCRMQRKGPSHEMPKRNWSQLITWKQFEVWIRLYVNRNYNMKRLFQETTYD